MTHTPRWTMTDGMVSPLGAALARLPPTLARPWIWIPPIIHVESNSAGYVSRTASFS